MSSNVTTHPVEHRRQERFVLPDPPVVSDANTGEILGQIVNLSSDGLMMAGPTCLPPGSLRQLRVRVEQKGNRMELLLGVESLWCQDAHDSGTWWTGFQIIDISAGHQALLDSLLEN